MRKSIQPAPDVPPAELVTHLSDYWVLQGQHGRNVYIPRDLNERLREWDEPRSTGVQIMWPSAVAHGFTEMMAYHAVNAALARRGKRHRFTVTLHDDGQAFVLTKIPGSRALPDNLRRELYELRQLERSLPDVGAAIELQAAREDLQRRIKAPFEYRRRGLRRTGSKYQFEDWAPGTWRCFPATVTSPLIRGSFHDHCLIRGIKGRLECLKLSDGRLAVLRHGQSERPYPNKPEPSANAIDAPEIIMQGDHRFAWVPMYQAEPLISAARTFTGHEKIAVIKPHSQLKPRTLKAATTDVH
jgi:hypothetical protein